MNVLNLFGLAWKALLRNKLRAFLTMLGIIIGVGSVITMVAIGEGSKQSIRDQLSGMGSNMINIRPSSNVTVGGGARLGAGDLQTLKVADATSIKNNAKFVTAVSPAVTANGQVINGALNWPSSMQGVSPDYLSIREWKLQSGIVFSDEDVATGSSCFRRRTDGPSDPGGRERW